MRFKDLPLDPSARTLRQFAVLWVLFFGGLAWWRAPGTLSLIYATAALLGPVGFVWPRLLRPIFVGWIVAAFPVGWVVSRVLLAVMYYGLFAPLALLFRLVGRDALRRHVRPAGESYWVPKPVTADVGRYYRQF